MAGQAFLFVSGILVAKLLGVENRGYLAVLAAFVLALNQLGLLGLPQSITYYAAIERDKTVALWKLLKPSLLTQLVVLVSLHVLIVAMYTKKQSNLVIWAGIATLPALPGMLVMEYGLGFLKGIGHFRAFNVYRLLPSLWYACAALIIWLCKGNLVAISLAWGLGYLGIGMISLHAALQGLSGPLESPGRRVGDIFRFGLKGWLGNISPLQSFRLDQIMAGLLLSPSAAGLYVVALAFTNLPSFIAQSVGAIACPAIASDMHSARGRFRIFFWATTALNAFAVTGIIILIPWVLSIFFGHDFVAASDVARILMVGAFLTSTRSILGDLYRGWGCPEVSTYGEIAIYPWFFLVAPWLMFRWKLAGLAWAVTSAYGIALLVAWVSGWRIEGSPRLGFRFSDSRKLIDASYRISDWIAGWLE
jgi:O-antigen/teichoic acid export membrane protein